MSNKRPYKGASLIELPKDYVAIDLETTGRSPLHDRIIELGAVRYHEGVAIDSFQQLVNPGFQIDSYVASLTGITNEMLADASSEEFALRQLTELIDQDDILVGHNIASFDANFLYDAGLRSLGEPINNSFVDTLRIARLLHPDWEHHRLCDLCAHYGIENVDSHRALGDAYAAAACFEALRNEIGEMFGSADGFCVFMKKRVHSQANATNLDQIPPTVDSFALRLHHDRHEALVTA